MSGPDHYVTAAMNTIIETRPVAAALEDWIRLAASGAAREARTAEALAIIDRLGKFMAFEGMTLEAAEEAPNVVGLFERRARTPIDRRTRTPFYCGDCEAVEGVVCGRCIALRDGHPSVDSVPTPAHGIRRPYPWRSEEALALAREEFLKDQEMDRRDGA